MLTEIEVYLTCDPKTLALQEEARLSIFFPEGTIIAYDDENDQMVASLMVDGPSEAENLCHVLEVLAKEQISYNKISVVP